MHHADSALQSFWASPIWYYGIRGLAVVVVYLAVRWARREYEKKFLTQYLFFLRFPILLGGLAFLVPLLALGNQLPDTLNDLFVIGSFRAAMWLVFFATIVAWAIIYSGELIAHSSPIRNKLYYDRAAQEDDGALPPFQATLIRRRDFLYAVLIMIPLILTVIVKSDAHGWHTVWVAAGTLLGFLLANWLAGKKTEHWVGRFLGLQAVQRVVATRPVNALARVASAHPEAHNARKAPRRPVNFSYAAYARLHQTAATYALVSGVIYLGFGLTFLLSWRAGERIPALTYVMALSLVLVWALGWLSLKFDVYRVPVFTLILVVLSGWYLFLPHRHIYVVQPLLAGETAPPATSALDRFAIRSDGTLVAVAASGGGIAAEYWTAVVLSGIGTDFEQQHRNYDFHRHVAVVSSVSGGTVGCMYYLDTFDPDPARTSLGMKNLVERAEVNTLSSVAWGLAYPDTWRIPLGHFLGRYDRGWRLERSWAERLSRRDTMMHDWTDGVLAGWRPIPIFNITVEETGERLALSPLDMYDRTELRSQFVRLMATSNLSVATAARLSASFPYVAPRALPDTGLCPADLHGADGGYFDNTGVYSALTVLDRWLRTGNGDTPGVKRIALVEISPFSPNDFVSTKTASDNVLDAVAGPVMTLYNVRSASQQARKDSEFAALQDLWLRRYKVRVERFTFFLATDPPLSWLLTADERAAIRSQWPDSKPPQWENIPPDEQAAYEKQRSSNRAQLDALARFLTTKS